MIENKIKSAKVLSALISRFKKESKKIIFTNGCFDMLHYGHVKYLEDAKSFGDILIVAVNSDKSVKMIKDPTRPVMGQIARARVIAALASVDYVTVFDAKTPYSLIKLLKPHVLVKGGDWKINDIVGSDIVKKYGGKVINIKYIKGYSTTSIINKIKEITPLSDKDKKACLRILDVNFNRTQEGLRVCEDVIRFLLNDRKLQLSFKLLRHDLKDINKRISADFDFVQSRDVAKDIGKQTDKVEIKRNGLSDIFKANAQRTKESLRSLEETSKMINTNISYQFKKARFRFYSIEKTALKKIRNVID